MKKLRISPVLFLLLLSTAASAHVGRALEGMDSEQDYQSQLSKVLSTVENESGSERKNLGDTLGGTNIISVTPDHGDLKYTADGTAHFLIRVLTAPSNPAYTIGLEATFPDSVTLNPLTSRNGIYFAQTPTLVHGTPTFYVNAYLESTSRGHDNGDLIFETNERIQNLRSEIDLEKDESLKNALIEMRSKLENAKAKLVHCQDASRVLIQQVALQLNVRYDDFTPPTISFNPPSGSYVGSNTPTLTVNYTDIGTGSAPASGVDPSSVKLVLDGNDVTFMAQVTAGTASIRFTTGSPLSNGTHNLQAQVSDLAGNVANQTASFSVNGIPPVITLGVDDHYLTNKPAWIIPITVIDPTPTSTTVSLNGMTVNTSPELSYSVPITLAQGPNVIVVTSTDTTGLSSSVTLSDVVLDTTPPVLSQLVPSTGDTIRSPVISASGQSNEQLQSVTLNGVFATLSEDRKSFTVTETLSTVGATNLHWVAADMAGNYTAQDVPVVVTLKVLNGDLLTVLPAPDNVHLLILGAVGAALPGVTVSADAGFLNAGSAVAAADGSFTISISAFSSATISATDPQTNLVTSATVTYGSMTGTTLAGSVKDTDGNPLQGATITISGSGNGGVRITGKGRSQKVMKFDPPMTTVQTAGDGSFIFNNPPTGAQTITIDGTTIPQSVSGVGRSFSKTSAQVNVGINQNNLISRPFYLNPILMDGSAAAITPSSSGPITNTHASGVQLNIPVGATQFPNGTQTGMISMATISTSVTTIPPPAFAVPAQVVALEPSGTTFSQRVPLTLPNAGHVPAGVQMVVMSMNSSKGSWEIDGSAQVSADGGSVITKSGQGISHFSMVYAVPLGPAVKQVGAQDQDGADTFNGALSTSVTLPSYKVLGNDVAPTLMYKSSWAKPTVLVSSIFAVPKQEFDIATTTVENGVSPVQTHCFVFGLLCDTIDNFWSATSRQTYSSWYTPDNVTAQFTSNGITSPIMLFNQGLSTSFVISYAVDLQDPVTKVYEPSGIYPYSSHYSLSIGEQQVSTSKVTEWSTLGGTQVLQDSSWSNYQVLSQTFPKDLQGPIFVENETNSPVGKGWKIGGVQTIANPTAGQVMLEEGDGTLSSYTIANTISSVYTLPTSPFTTVTLDSADLNIWPKALVSILDTSAQTSTVSQVDLTGGSGSPSLGALAPLTGQINEFDEWEYFQSANPGGFYTNWVQEAYSYSITRRIPWLKLMPDQSIFGLSKTGDVGINYQGGTAFKFSMGNYSLIAGLEGVKTFNNPYANSDESGPCRSNWNISCPLVYYRVVTQFGKWLPYQPIGPLPPDGTVPLSGYTDGPLAGSAMNNPTSMALGPNNTIVIADSGNNVVRMIDQTSGTITTIAGNSNATDSGDGGDALSAGINRPRGVAYDSLGNLYISTASGLIRRVDPTTNTISTFAGATADNNGALTMQGSAALTLFNNPYGMVVDNQKGYLYVADSGYNRVVRIDFLTMGATQVAGTDTCVTNGPIGDTGPALNASLCNPTNVGLDDSGNLLVLDQGHNAIRRVIFAPSVTGALTYLPSKPDYSMLARNSDSTWTRTYRNGSVISFDNRGRQTGALDRVGRQVTYGYSGNNLTLMTDPMGKSTTYTYSGNQLSSIVDPAGRTTYFTVISGLLTQVAFPDGTTKNYAYNAQGLMTSETDQRGNATQYGYNVWNRLNTVTRADGAVTSINDSGSGTAANNYNSANPGTGLPYGAGSGQANDGILDPKSNSTVFVKDNFGYVSTIVDASGNTTTIDRDSFGNPTTITRPDGTTATFAYQVTTDPEFGRTVEDLVSQTDSATGITTFQSFDSYGNNITNKNGRGNTSHNNFDPTTGRLTSATDPLGHGVTYGYGTLGLVTSVTNSLQYVSQATYDSTLGNVAKSTDQLGGFATFTRDSAGNVLSSKNANLQITQYTFDYFNRLTSVTTPKNEKTQYAYLATGQLSQIIDPFGNLTLFTYDLQGRLLTKTDPLGFVTSRTYDLDGNVISESDPNGNVKNYVFNNLNQLTSKTLPDNVITLSYDIRGHVVGAQSHQSEISNTFDDGGRLASTRAHGLGSSSGLADVTLSFGYDFDNNRATLTAPGAANYSYSYDLADRLASLNNPKGETYLFGFDAASRLISQSRPGGSSTFSFDARDIVTSIVHVTGASTLATFQYQMDPIGNRTQITNQAGSKNYSYDLDNQVVTASNPEATLPSGFQSETFSFDSTSNRSSDQGGGYIYDSKDQRLAQDYRYFYFYDNNGNLTSKQEKGLTGEVTNFSYSSENQLLGFKVYPSANNPTPTKIVSYVYDVIGRRVSKQVVDETAPNDPAKTFTRHYAYDGQEILLEYDGNNNLLASYTHSGLATDDVLAVNITSAGVTAELGPNVGSYQYLKDAQGTVTDVADNQGNKIQHFVYSAFGTVLAIEDGTGTVTTTPALNTSYMFAGAQYDSESGLYHSHGTRMYDSTTGRWIQQDPYPGKLSMPITRINRYIYTGNNPINYVDPSGELFEILDTIGSAASSIGKLLQMLPGPLSYIGLSIKGIGESLTYVTNSFLLPAEFRVSNSIYYGLSAVGVPNFALNINAISEDVLGIGVGAADIVGGVATDDPVPFGTGVASVVSESSDLFTRSKSFVNNPNSQDYKTKSLFDVGWTATKVW